MHSLRVLFDSDGLVSGFVEHYLRTVGSDKTRESIRDWDIFAAVTTQQKAEGMRAMGDPDWWLSIPVLPGSQEAVERVRRAGHTIYWITTPWDDCKGWMWARKKWFKNHFDESRHRVIPVHDKWIIGGDVFSDDRAQNVVEWSINNKSGRAILFDAPWNKDSTCDTRMSWDDVDNSSFSFLFGKNSELQEAEKEANRR